MGSVVVHDILVEQSEQYLEAPTPCDDSASCK